MTGLLTKDDLGVLEQVLPKSNGDAGVRIFGNSQLNDWLCSGPVSGAVRSRMPGAAAVRAILFDKSTDRNWSLGWHQDRMIAVRQRTVAPGFDHWTVKNDILHVEPPIGILEGMITMRIHLDPVGEDNAPLLVAPGSHQFGRIREQDIDAVVQRCGRLSCLA
ncbi:MAG: phytanoyl-CoA dioxygenase family protein, partial [Sphingomonas sp.]|nr:phytanoyl-CoA dioxygenase family protein [Sphingomonas sp.]